MSTHPRTVWPTSRSAAPPRRQALKVLVARHERAKVEAWQTEMAEIMAEMREANEALVDLREPKRSWLRRVRDNGWLW